MDRRDMMGVFLSEVENQLQLLEREILNLERQGESPPVIQSLFRIAHTLKGSSAAMGFEDMKRLTHEMENVLDKLRKQQMPVTPQVVNLLLQCLDHLHGLKKEIEQEGATRTNVDAVVCQLRQLDNRLWRCKVRLSDRCEMKGARAHVILNRLKNWASVLSIEPDPDSLTEEAAFQEISFILATSLEPGTLQQQLRELTDVEDAEVAPFANDSADDLAAPAAEAERDATPENRNPPGNGKEGKKIGQTVRVDVDLLESIMNLVGELVIDQTRIVQVGNRLRDRYAADETLEDLEQITNRFSRIIGELQESVMKTRMLPIEHLFSRFPRMVRDLSRTLNKDVHLVLEGKETELDRTVIEEIGDPLIHLIRNAIDHGIEAPEVRQRLGKPARGTIRITASHQENQVVLTVEDDGAGIDAQKVKETAVARQLIPAQNADTMSEAELLQLIFLPGFSTASTVSEISGRGVGMDIVRNHIEKLNGLIDVETRLGQGTKFTIKLPLTLAILRGLLIRLRDTIYALPMSSVVEIVRIPKKDIRSIKGQAVVKIRDKVVPLIRLHDYFRIPAGKTNARHVFIVVVGLAEKRLGLVVDELIGNQEIVVKSIGSYIGKIEGVSGATILGDGSVALILDVTGLFRLADHFKAIESGNLDDAV